MKTKLLLLLGMMACCVITTTAQPQQRRERPRRMAYQTDTVMVHDPVMAYENGTYYLLSTGNGVQWATSKDRKTWVIQPLPFIENIPEWTRDSVPGLRSHLWAPDIVRWHDRWWLAYSCSTFGKNTSAIGLMSSERLNGHWRDEGCLVASKEHRDNWNAIDPCFVVDDNDQLWLTWGSFWDGIQLAQIKSEDMGVRNPTSTLSLLVPNSIRTIARRYRADDPNAAENPTSKFAGRNAIEAPFIMKHHGYYYLFVSWDYCCRGAQSNYRVAVGRSKHVEGPYLDKEGRNLLDGGGTLILEGDKQQFEAAGHCAAYSLPDGDLFICHGYSIGLNGASILLQKPITWPPDGWPSLQ